MRRVLMLCAFGLVGCTGVADDARDGGGVLPPTVIDDHGAGGGKADELLGSEKADIEDRIRGRAPALRQLKAGYFIGESANGYLALPPGTTLTAEQAQLVCAENTDRDRLYDIETDASLSLLALILERVFSEGVDAAAGAAGQAFGDACVGNAYLAALGLCGDLAAAISDVPTADLDAELIGTLVESTRDQTRRETQVRFANFFRKTLRTGEWMTVGTDADDDGDAELCWVPRPEELSTYRPGPEELSQCDQAAQPLCP